MNSFSLTCMGDRASVWVVPGVRLGRTGVVALPGTHADVAQIDYNPYVPIWLLGRVVGNVPDNVLRRHFTGYVRDGMIHAAIHRRLVGAGADRQRIVAVVRRMG